MATILPGPLVDAGWLAAHRHEVDIADVRWSLADGPKWNDYLNGHLPGAVFVDLDTDLSDPPGQQGRHPLPSVERFRGTMSELGLGARPVVCYDDSSGATAARLWWMLDAVGHPAAVLDGGIDSWNGNLASGEPEAGIEVNRDTVGEPTIREWPGDRVVVVDQIVDLVGDGTPLLDARSGERFRGEPNPVDPVLGHIPGATSRPWNDNIGSSGSFRPPAELRHAFAALGVDGAAEWIASCGSGVTACHNLLAARVAGLGDGRLYAGSWSEWISDSSRPVDVGAGTPSDGG